jgi:Rad52/22 family double-strand break repair protein
MSEPNEAGFITPISMRDKLRAPLPDKAVKPHPSKSWMSSINGAYIVERLNDVFGEDGWSALYEVIENNPQQKMIVVRVHLYANDGQKKIRFLRNGEPDPETYTFYRQTFGGNDNPDRGDAYKGACTDALGKAASQLGIASEVYKGMLDEGQAPAEDGKRPGRKPGRAKTDDIVHVDLALVTKFKQTQKNLAFLEVGGMNWVARDEHVCRILQAGRVAVGSKIELHGRWGKFGKSQQDCIFITSVGSIYQEKPETPYQNLEPVVQGVPLDDLET